MKERLQPVDPELVADGLQLLTQGEADYFVFGEGDRVLHVVEPINDELDAAAVALIRAGVEPAKSEPNGMAIRVADAIGRRIKKLRAQGIDLTE